MCVCVCRFWSVCVLSKLLWKRIFLTYLLSTRSKATKPQAKFIIQEEEVEAHTSKNKRKYKRRTRGNLIKTIVVRPQKICPDGGSRNLSARISAPQTWRFLHDLTPHVSLTPRTQRVFRLTCVERQRVDEGSGDLLRRSLVPQREVVGVEHALLVLRRQEVS